MAGERDFTAGNDRSDRWELGLDASRESPRVPIGVEMLDTPRGLQILYMRPMRAEAYYTEGFSGAT